jgi:hypothetical protein
MKSIMRAGKPLKSTLSVHDAIIFGYKAWMDVRRRRSVLIPWTSYSGTPGKEG